MKAEYRAARFLLVLIAVTLILFGNSQAQETTTLVDIADRTVTVSNEPKRIVCLAPGTLRLICYLGAQDKLVGIERFEKVRPVGRPYWLANPQLARLPVVGPGGPKSINHDPDLEAVLGVRPDVIFISYMQSRKADDLQNRLGIPVVVVSYGEAATFDPTVYRSLRILGKVMGKERRAEEIVTFIEGARTDLFGRVAGVEYSKKSRVYVGGIGYKGSQGIESTDAAYVPLNWVKARNVATEIRASGHLFLDKEKILSWNPDIIFVDAGGMDLVRADYRKKPEFYRGLAAVQNKSIYQLLPFNYYMTNLGTAVADAYACGKILYPDRFGEIDLPKKTDAIYTFLLGAPLYRKMEETFGELGARVEL